MKRLGEIDAFISIHPTISEQERAKLHQAKCQQQKEDGYQQLAELCRLGEYDTAKQLANQHLRWGYQIVDGVVMERLE